MPNLNPLSLRVNITWTLAGNAVYVLCQWAVIVILAKLGTPTLVGQYALGLAIATPAFVFSSLALRTLLVTDTKNTHPFGVYLALRLTLTTLVFIAIFAGYSMASTPGETSMIVIAVAALKGSESINEIFYGFIQKHERMDAAAKSKAAKGVVTLAALSAALMLGYSLFIALLAALACRMLIFCLFDLTRCALVRADAEDPDNRLTPAWNFSAMHRLFFTALPLGIVLMLISLSLQMPRIFLEGFHDEHALGIFAALASLLAAGNQVVSALGESASPQLAKRYNDMRYAEFRTLSLKLIGFSAMMGALATLAVTAFGRPLLTLLFDAEYAEYNQALIIIMAASIFFYPSVILGYCATTSRRLRYQPWLVIVVAAATFAACMAIIPSYGVVGAAYVILISAATRIIAYLVLFLFQSDKDPVHSTAANPV